MILVKAPNPVPDPTYPTVFTAGSIEMGTAEPWQAELAAYMEGVAVTILDPRREAWSDMSPDDLHEQITWELNGIARADLVVFYFDPATKSPISLLELGLVLGSKPGRVLVCCPTTFYRYDNVEITCAKYGVAVCHTKRALFSALHRRFERND